MVRIFTRLHAWLFKDSIIRRARQDALAAWPSVRRIWASSDAVYLGAYGYGGTVPIESELIDAMTSCDTAKDVFLNATRDENPILAGYAIEALRRLKLLHLIPEEVNLRQESIVARLGCARIEQHLGGFAKISATIDE